MSDQVKRYRDAIYLLNDQQADVRQGVGAWYDAVKASDYDAKCRELAEAREANTKLIQIIRGVHGNLLDDRINEAMERKP